MLADGLPHALLASDVDLPSRNGDTLNRRGNRRGDHRAHSAPKPRKLGLRQSRQAVPQRNHVIAEQTAERRV